MKLNISFESFTIQIDEFIVQGVTLLSFENAINTQKALLSAKTDVGYWKEEFKKFLINCFTPESDIFYNLIFNPKDKYSIHIEDFLVRNETELNKFDLFYDVKTQNELLAYVKKIMSVSDTFIDKGNEINKEGLKTDDIIDLILEKLYYLYDDKYYSVSLIIKGNGIELKRINEAAELIAVMLQRGLISVERGKESNAQLTLKGKIYIEKKRKKSYNNIYDDVNRSQKELNNKIDEIIDNIRRQGIGQEILFDELQELKELYKTMKKKNWGEVLKGKLIDLTLAKIIEKETLDYIYQALTNHVLRLP